MTPAAVTLSLICVDPARVSELWPFARDLIRIAIERTKLSRFDVTESDVLAGRQLLWLAWGDGIEAAATTQLADNVCTITACGGARRHRWLSLIRGIEDYARAEGCRCVRLFGRKGWQRALEGYEVRLVVMEQELANR